MPKICQSVNKSSVLLLTEISRLISDCIAYKKSLSDVIVRDYPIVHSLISMLSVDLFNYGEFAKNLVVYSLKNTDRCK